MAVTATVYGGFLSSLANKEIDLDSDSVKVMLCTSTYTPNQDTHRYKNSVTNEVTGTGYTAGGATLANKDVSYNAGTNTLTFTNSASTTWGSSTITARYAVFYVDTGTASTSPLICYWDFGQDEISSNGNFTLTYSGSGIITATIA